MTIGGFADISIRIVGWDEDAGCYRVEAETDDGSHYTHGELRVDRDSLLAAASDAHEYGRALGAALFTGEILRAYERVSGRADAESGGRVRVRLWIDDDAADLHALAWERLYHTHRGRSVALAASVLTPFSRYAAVPIGRPVPVETRPIRVLFAISDPRGLPPGFAALDAAVEVQTLRAALGGLVHTNVVKVTVVPGRSGLPPALEEQLQREGYDVWFGPTTLETLVRLATEHHVLHFVGHGDFRRDEDPPRAALYLEGADGTWDPTPEDVLADKITAGHPMPSLVFLAACESARRDPAGRHAHVGIAPRLVAAGVPAVVAMQDVVPIESARTLSFDFYRNLMTHGVVDVALNQARLVLADRDDGSWAVPVLFSRLEAGRLFAPAGLAGRVLTTDVVVDAQAPHGVRADRLADPPPAPRRVPPPVFARPRAPQGMLDRRPEIEAAAAAAAASAPLEFFGPTGAGKTTLLRHLAHSDGASPVGGVVYVGAAGRSPEDILQFVFDSLYEVDAPFKPTDGQLRRYLQDADLLVMVDDCSLTREQIQGLLDVAPACSFVIATTVRSMFGEGVSLAVGGLPPEDCIALFERELGRALEAHETQAVHELAAAAAGNPLHVLQAAARAGEVASVPATGSAASLDELSEAERRALSVLVGVRGAPIHQDHVAAVAGAEALRALPSLERLHLARSASPVYRLADAPERVDPGSDAYGVVEELFDHFAWWVRRNRNDTGLLMHHADAVLATLEAARADGVADPRRYLNTARALEPALIVGRRWGRWERLLRDELAVATDAGDRDSIAWTLHQRGTRALCAAEPDAAAPLLQQAVRLRTELGDHDGADASRHNLELTGAPEIVPELDGGAEPLYGRAAVEDRPAAAPARRWWWLIAAVAAVAAVAIGIRVLVTEEGIAIDPRAVDLGDVVIGDRATQEVVVTNATARSVEFARVRVEPRLPALAAQGDCATGAIAPGAACTVVVAFEPDTAGTVHADLVLVRTEGREPERVPITGTGIPPQGRPALSFDPDDGLNFGERRPVTAASMILTVTSRGALDLEIERIALEGDDAFTISDHNCTPRRLMPRDSSCTVVVEFRPPTGGAYRGAVVITDNAAGSPHRVPVTGSVPAADVIVERIRQTGGAVFRDGYFVVPVEVDVANLGPGEAPPFPIAVRYTGGEAARGEPVYVWFSDGPDDAPLEGELGVRVTAAPVPPDITTTVPGYVWFPASEQDAKPTVVAVGDACILDGMAEAPCRVVETDEDNNVSPEITVVVQERPR